MDDRGAAAPHAELAVDPFQVSVDGVGGDTQFLGNDPLSLVVEDALENLQFAVRQPEREGQ